MILAVAEYANGEEGAPKPKELALLETCRRWNKLPRAGGILDQPFGLLDRMTAADSISRSIQTYNANWNKGEWTAQNPEVMRLMTRYWALRDEVEKNGSI